MKLKTSVARVKYGKRFRKICVRRMMYISGEERIVERGRRWAASTKTNGRIEKDKKRRVDTEI